MISRSRADLPVQLGHLLAHLRRVRAVGVAHVVGALHVHEQQVGDLVRAKGLTRGHLRQRFALEALEQARRAERRGVRDVVPHPRAAGLLPEGLAVDRLQVVGQRVALGVGLPPGVARAVAGGPITVRPFTRHAPRPTRPAVARMAPPWPTMMALPSVVRFQTSASVRAISSRGSSPVVGRLRLAGHPIEQVVGSQPVDARIGAGADRGVSDAGERGQVVDAGVREPRAFARRRD